MTWLSFVVGSAVTICRTMPAAKVAIALLTEEERQSATALDRKGDRALAYLVSMAKHYAEDWIYIEIADGDIEQFANEETDEPMYTFDQVFPFGC